MLDWTRLADEAGFHSVGTIDKPNYDPLVMLAGVAAVTERVKLTTTILLLPPRNEVLVAKQATVDRPARGAWLAEPAPRGRRGVRTGAVERCPRAAARSHRSARPLLCRHAVRRLRLRTWSYGFCWPRVYWFPPDSAGRAPASGA